MSRRPLEGLRVVELGLALAGPFAGSLMAELGAQVIKIEKPGGGDPARLMGISVKDVAVWWGVAARAKLCIDLDLKNPDDRQTFLDLVASADAMIENYRPGVLDRMGLGWEDLRKLNPRLVMASISGFGQTGPQSGRPGFGKIAEAMSGIVMLTGAPDQVPTHIGFSLADTSAGLMGAFGLALGLYQRDVGGQSGTHADVALFEPLFRIAECQLALAERIGRAPLREGSNDPYGWGVSGRSGDPSGVAASGDAAAGARHSGSRVDANDEAINHDALRALCCADGHWLMMPALTDAVLAREVESLDIESALRRLAAAGVEAARVHDGASIAEGDYFRARGDARAVSHPVAGALVVPGEVTGGGAWDQPALPLFRPTRPDADRDAVLS